MRFNPSNHAYGSADAKVRRDRSVHTTSVRCPECDAPPGEKCRSLTTGEPVACPHRSRRRMAVRAANDTQTYNVADVLYAQRTTKAYRKQARKIAGLSSWQLAEVLSVVRGTLLTWEDGKSLPAGPGGAAYGAWLRENDPAKTIREKGTR